jgi:hypothetical protein
MASPLGLVLFTEQYNVFSSERVFWTKVRSTDTVKKR